MTRKVLFVDDDLILLKAVENRFKNGTDQFSLVTASDGFDACKKLEKIEVSLILIDLIMPRMDGMSLLSHVNEKYPDVPVFLMSSMEEDELCELAGKCGVRGYICKPFTTDELTSIIVRTLNEEADGGIINDISPGVFLQLMEMEAKTCTIRIFDNNSDSGGILYFHEGQLLDARVGLLNGVDAAYLIFSWQNATMYITKKCSLTENRINSDLGPIIMHAATMHDELLADSEMGDEDGPLTGPFGTGEPEASGDRNSAGKVDLHLRSLKAQLEDHFGKEYVPEMLAMSEPMSKVIDAMKYLSELSGLGAFQLAHVTSETGEKILLNGDEPLVLRFETSCQLDKIVDFLQMRDQR